MIITYVVDDGSSGPRTPHHVYVDSEDLLACEDANERDELINESVQDHFEQHVMWEITKRSDEP